MSRQNTISLNRVMPAALVVTALLLGGFVLIGQTQDSRANAQNEADQNAFWTVSGPPCPQQTRAEFQAAALQPKQAFDFQGAIFARAFGEADCRAYGDAFSSYRRCMFTSPGVVRVASGQGEAFYAPGIGRPVTVSVEKGRISCVMGSRVIGPAAQGADVREPTAKGWLAHG